MKKHSKGFSWLVSMALVLIFDSMGFAYGSSISGTVKEHSTALAVPWASITVKGADTGLLAGAASTDALGNFSVAIPAPGKYLILAAQFGYLTMAAPEVIELSDAAPDQTVNLALSKEPLTPAQTPPARTWGTGAGKSYLIPALEIPAFLTLLSLYDRHAFKDQTEGGVKVYSSTLSTTWDHIRQEHWVIDQDPFSMNQLGHPYQGATFHGFARSAGLNYWQALLYDNYGSYLWKMGGETDEPSLNDQIATGISGSFFGEVLFRMASLVLEGDGSEPGFFRKLGATALSPPTMVNWFVFGDRFKSVFPSDDPAIFWRLQFGASLHSDLNDGGVTSTIDKDQGSVRFTMAYGLPGQAGYSYTRPFDYFQVEAAAIVNAADTDEDILIRGLLLGTDYGSSDAYQGIWGLYGGYDYISPEIFRISSTSVSLGTTFQSWLSDTVALQGSLLGGMGFAAAGNISPVGQRDYHYGFAPQGLLALRLILGHRAMFDMTERFFDVTGAGGDDPGGSEVINRINMGFTLRIFGCHSLGIHYITSTRDARYPDRPNSHQSIGTVALAYTLLGDTGFGAVND
ncbi:MAG: DUF3943 domain-containing protein [Holophaga sp.]|jgi:hypothetical protein